MRVDGGTFVTGTLILGSNIVLEITRGTILQGIRTTSQYPSITAKRKCFRCNEPLSLLFAEGERNISIFGGDTVDGNDGGRENPWSGGSGGRPRLLRFVDIDSLDIRNISFIRSACWTVFLSGGRFVVIDSMAINSRTGQGNQDGIDIALRKHRHQEVGQSHQPEVGNAHAQLQWRSGE